jgi:hypothetical protein
MLRAPAPRGRFDCRDPRSFVTVSDTFALLHGVGTSRKINIVPICCGGQVWSCSMRQRPGLACCQSFTQCHSCNKCNSPVILPCASETRKRLADLAWLRACRPGWRERYAAGGIRALDDTRHCPPGLAEGSPRLAPTSSVIPLPLCCASSATVRPQRGLRSRIPRCPAEWAPVCGPFRGPRRCRRPGASARR